MKEFALSCEVVSREGDQLYSIEYAALITTVSTVLIQHLVELGLIEPIGTMLRSRDIARIAQIQRLHLDLGLNFVGAAMVLDMAQEIAQLKARIRAYQEQ
ncbi:hypothetical protein BZZ01_10990 [Nostocales cyanobacterium HT-58-2]|nr:hypothetical protein BZZ01_10990 [Nostocales cyanobacterium HT-58-2]